MVMTSESAGLLKITVSEGDDARLICSSRGSSGA